MKTVYRALLDRIKTKVPAIRWVDLDRGQLTFPKENYTMDYPAVLISFSQIQWRSVGEGLRQGDCLVSFRLVFPTYYDMNNHTPDSVVDQAIEQLEITDELDACLEGYSTENFNELQLTSSIQEPGEQGFLVFNYSYNTLISKMPPASNKVEKTLGANITVEI